MPQKGQKSITLSKSKIPKDLTEIINDYGYSMSSLVTYSLWAHFGTAIQKKQAKKILRLFVYVG